MGNSGALHREGYAMAGVVGGISQSEVMDAGRAGRGQPARAARPARPAAPWSVHVCITDAARPEHLSEGGLLRLLAKLAARRLNNHKLDQNGGRS